MAATDNNACSAPTRGGLPNNSASHLQTSTQHSSWEEFKVPQLKGFLKERNLPVSGKKAELIQRLVDHDKGSSTDHEEGCGEASCSGSGPNWETSKSKAILTEMYLDDNHPVHIMSLDDIMKIYSEFQLFPKHRFKENLKNLRKAVKKRKEVIQENERDFHKEQLAFKRKPLTIRGYPFFDTHAASAFLREDVKNKKADALKPIKLRETREEYQAFPVKVFCSHVHQEKRKQREKAYWIPARNKEATRLQQEEAQQIKSEWDTSYVQDEVKALNDRLQNMSQLH